MIQMKIGKKEEDLNRDFEEKSKILEEERERNRTKLNESEVKVKQMQQLLDESQNDLFEIRNRQEHQSNASTEEVDLLLGN